jgi:hypothetical protein
LPASAASSSLVVILDEELIEDAKIAAIRGKTKVSAVVEKLLREWVDGQTLKKSIEPGGARGLRW